MDEITKKYNEIFNPGIMEDVELISRENRKFVYYTSAETAMKIINNKELWFRSTTVMNDFSEVSYGIALTKKVFSGPEGLRFREAIDEIIPGTMEKVEEYISKWEDDWRYETYIACVSMHEFEEDNHGRLSMWRAYGNTALVLNNTPMMSVTDKLEVFSMPVLYVSEEGFSEYLSRITDSILINRKYLMNLGGDTLVSYVSRMLFRFAIATKHPGFKEEKEWRLFHRPSEGKSPCMVEEITIINGVPQKIYKLRLANEPENDLHGADIPSLISRVIIGPTSYPYVSYMAFLDCLNKAGTIDADRKVFCSSIPIRLK